jgi:hypothetical protein
MRKGGVWSTRRPKGMRRGSGIIHSTRTGLRSGGYYYFFLMNILTQYEEGSYMHILHSTGRKL